MVRGLDTFREYFMDYAENYLIIGGTACSELIEEDGLGTAGLSKELGLGTEITFDVFSAQFKNVFRL